MMTKKTKNKYNHYTEDYRCEAIHCSKQDGVSAIDVSREQGIHRNQIYYWRNQYRRLSEKQFNTMNGVVFTYLKLERGIVYLAVLWVYFPVRSLAGLWILQ